jgi:hypothetical protein
MHSQLSIASVFLAPSSGCPFSRVSRKCHLFAKAGSAAKPGRENSSAGSILQSLAADAGVLLRTLRVHSLVKAKAASNSQEGAIDRCKLSLRTNVFNFRFLQKTPFRSNTVDRNQVNNQMPIAETLKSFPKGKLEQEKWCSKLRLSPRFF